jgi:hypothetical protein
MQVLKFAEVATFGRSQSVRDFGSGIVRSQYDQIADIAEGKIAELGFMQFLKKNFNLETVIDFNHYESIKVTDLGNDMELYIDRGEKRISTFKVDVKATKPYSKWLLVEGHKFWANAYVLIKTELPRCCESDPYASIKGKIKVEVVGFAYYTDFIDPITRKPWIEYSSGDELIDPAYLTFASPILVKDYVQTHSVVRLQCTLKSPSNYGLPVSHLRKDKDEWKNLIYKVRTSTIETKDNIIKPRY